MTEKIQVLYVDDETDLLTIGKLFLERLGNFSVTTTPGAVEAISILKSRSFDAIISDYQMPKMDGITFLKHLKSEGDSTPFILFTGKGREEVVIEALNNGADFYLQKGGDPRSQFAELEHKVRQAVSYRQSKESLATSIEDLRKISSRYEVLIAASNTGAWEYNFDSGQIWCSPEYFSMLARDIHDYDIRSIRNIEGIWTDLVHPDDRDEAVRRLNEYMKYPGGMYEHYFRMLHSDGSWRWILSRGKMLPDREGRSTNIIVGTNIDVTGRKTDRRGTPEKKRRTPGL